MFGAQSGAGAVNPLTQGELIAAVPLTPVHDRWSPQTASRGASHQQTQSSTVLISMITTFLKKYLSLKLVNYK